MLPHIYKITNDTNGKIYIGKSIGKYKHYFAGGKGLWKAIKKYGKENFQKEIIVQGNFNNLLLNELEKHYIRLFNSNNSKFGYNQTSGGDGAPDLPIEVVKRRANNFKGYKHTDEAKRKMSLVHKGKKLSKEQCELISKRNRGKKVSKDVIDKIIQTKKEKDTYRKIWTIERRESVAERMRGSIPWNKNKRVSQTSKPVDQYTIDGVFIKTWPSIRDAGEGTQTERGTISQAVKNKKYRTAGGFVWRFHGENLGEFRPFGSKPIIQKSLDNKFIKRWISASEASRQLNISRNGIFYALSKKYGTGHGFKWEYE